MPPLFRINPKTVTTIVINKEYYIMLSILTILSIINLEVAHKVNEIVKKFTPNLKIYLVYNKNYIIYLKRYFII